MKTFLELLKNAFEEKKKKNKRYSLRALSKFLNEESSYISKIFSEKRNLTPQKIWQYGELLGLDEKIIIDYVSSLTKNSKKNKKRTKSKKYESKDDEALFIASSREHFILPELLKLQQKENSISWIANFLKIDILKAEEIFKDLLAIDIVDKNFNAKGSYTFNVNEKNKTKAREIFKNILRSSLEEAIFSLEEEKNWHQMAHGVSYVAAHSENLLEARKKIGVFRKELSSFLETSLSPDKKPDILICLTTLMQPLDASSKNS